MQGESIQLLTLASMMHGGVEEQFQNALNSVLENISDPNTDPEARRRITLVFDFKSDDEGRRHGTARVAVSCVTKLATMKPSATHIHIGRHEGALAAREALKQEDMFPAPVGKPRAVASEGGA